jgi:SNF2 family DNA or RNA helicase
MKQIKLPFQKLSSVKGKPPLSKKSNQTILDSDDEETYSQPIEDEFISDINDLDLPNELITRMYPHQKEGVQWLYSLHLSQPGGILGDDMGLGKTFQVTCLLTGLMRNKLIQRALIVVPVSVLQTWERELRQHLHPHVKRIGIDIVNADMAKKKRQQILRDVFLSKHQKIIITSYHLVSNMMDDFGQGCWDYLILDEGHIIKNPSTKISKSMKSLPSKHRLLLTGTPIQNHLTEFWVGIINYF